MFGLISIATFSSPFNTTPQCSNNKSDINTAEQNKQEKTPLKGSIARRLLFQQTPSPKKLRLSEEDCNQTDNESKKILRRSDLEVLKQRIKQKEKTVRHLKTTILYRKKNKAEDLECAIQKWTESCQNALRDYQNSLKNDGRQSVAMSEILSSFNINPDTVRFSVDNDTFY